MDKLRKILKLAKILLLVMAIFAVASGWGLSVYPAGTHLHTPILVLFLISVALTAQLFFMICYCTFYLHNLPKRANQAAKADDLDREAREVYLAGLSVEDKNNALLAQEEKAAERKSPGVAFQVDHQASQGEQIVAHEVSAPISHTPPHQAQPVQTDDSLLFGQLELDSFAGTRTPGGAVLVQLMAYNNGPLVVDGSLTAEVLDNEGALLGRANLVLPRNGVRPHQTVNLSGVCIGPKENFPFDTIHCVPHHLYGYQS